MIHLPIRIGGFDLFIDSTGLAIKIGCTLFHINQLKRFYGWYLNENLFINWKFIIFSKSDSLSVYSKRGMRDNILVWVNGGKYDISSDSILELYLLLAHLFEEDSENGSI